jgi:hypothetical protein
MARSLEDIGGNLIDGFATGPTLLFPVIRRQVNRFRAPVSIATVGPATYSVAQLEAGIINRDPNGSSRTDTTPTAALIIGTFNLNFNDDTIQVLLRNTSDAAETITLAGGTGVTIGGAAVIAAGESRTLTFVRTSSTAVLCTIGAVGSFSGTFTGNLSVTGNITASGSLNGATLAVSGASALVDVTTTGLEKTAPSATPTNLTTNTDLTYTAAQLAVGIITRDPNGGARTDTTDIAANLITGLGLSADYQERYCTIVNTADAAETITLAGGTGVTLKGAITIAQNQATRLAFFRTGAAAVCVREV